MGLFSSKKKISVSSVSTPLIGENPDLLGKAILQSVMDGVDLVDQIVEDGLNGGGVKIKRAYRYARDEYTLGLPQGYEERTNFNEETVKQVIASQHPDATSLTVHTTKLDAGDAAMHVMDYLNKGFGWDYDTDVLTRPDNLNQLGSRTYFNTLENIKRSIGAQFYYVLTNQVRDLQRRPPGQTRTGVDADGNQYYIGYHRIVTTTEDYVEDVRHEVSNIDTDFGLNDDPVTFTIDFQTTISRRYSANITEAIIETKSLWAPDQVMGEDEPFSRTSTTSYTYYPVQETYVRNASITDDYVVDIDLGKNYYFATYTVVEPVGFEQDVEVKRTFLYDVDSEEFPELSFTKNTSVSNPMYPVVVMRQNNVDYCRPAAQDSELYQTSRKLLKKMDIDIQDIRNAINDNPDIGAIDHAYIVFGTRLNTDNGAGIEYLARFWEHMYLQYGGDYSTQTVEAYDEVTVFGNYTQKFNERTYIAHNGSGAGRFRVADGALNILIQWSDIKVEFTPGSIGKVGSTSRVFNDTSVEFRYQMDDDTYKAIKVFNPVLTNYVYAGKTVITDLTDARSETNNNFIIPLHYDIVNNMGTQQRNALYYDSLQLVFNSYEVTKVKWYQTGFFRAVLTIASIALAIYTAGASVAAFSTILAAQGLTAAVLWVIGRVILAIAMKYVFKLVVKAVGVEAALVIAVFAVAYGMYDLSQNNWTIADSAWANTLLQVANGISSGIEGNIQDGIIDLNRELEDFNNEVDAKNAELKAAQDLLTVDGLLDPFQFIRTEPMIFNYESPDNFYNRTVHSGNVGAMSFTLTTNYHDLMLDLPKPSYV